MDYNCNSDCNHGSDCNCKSDCNSGSNCMVDNMKRYLGQTVTVFTTSGGQSGSGFTGVLIYVDYDCIKLLCETGASPACPIGSACTGYYGGCTCRTPANSGYCCGNTGASGNGGNASGGGTISGRYNNPLGAVTEIPTCNIACFTHNAI